MKMFVRTFADVRIYPWTQFYPRTRKCVRADVRAWTRARADVARTRVRIHADTGPRGPVTARTRVDTRRAATGPCGLGGGADFF
jgi:hypothetical protein